MRKGLLAVIASCAVLACFATLPAGAHQSVTAAVTVTAGKPSEFKFTLTKKIVKHGTVVRFLVQNKGNVPHDFKIKGQKTKLLVPGATQVLKVTFLKKGTYPFLCTVTGHAVAGMKGVFKVT